MTFNMHHLLYVYPIAIEFCGESFGKGGELSMIHQQE